MFITMGLNSWTETDLSPSREISYQMYSLFLRFLHIEFDGEPNYHFTYGKVTLDYVAVLEFNGVERLPVPELTQIS